MAELLRGFHPVTQALIATCFTWLMTAAGAAVVFAGRDIERRVLDAMLGVAAGVSWQPASSAAAWPAMPGPASRAGKLIRPRRRDPGSAAAGGSGGCRR